MKNKFFLLFTLLALLFTTACVTQQQSVAVFPSIGSVGAMPIITQAQSRAVTMENPLGLPGQGGQAKGGRKGSPCFRNLEPGKTHTLMDIQGCGVIRHIWITIRPNQEHYRNAILRMYWDGADIPSVEVPILDFFAQAHGANQPLNSSLVCVTEGRGLNCYFPMPFASGAKITLENDSESPLSHIFYQIDYDLLPALPKNTGRFHAQWRRQNPTTKLQDYVILDNIDSPGVYIGTMIGVRTLGPHWWGEGEFKFYINNDTAFPTICGTGTEDYFCSAWGLGTYQNYYHGCTLLHTVDHDTKYVSLYRWHPTDPIHFHSLNKLTVQQIGWNNGLFERSDDWCSTAYWYQLGINQNLPPLPGREARSADLPDMSKE
ncbi:DUF2961 domain-containing protein [bacterium]|nr:DUF2961 domain-containing protein [bacterium]